MAERGSSALFKRFIFPGFKPREATLKAMAEGCICTLFLKQDEGWWGVVAPRAPGRNSKISSQTSDAVPRPARSDDVLPALVVFQNRGEKDPKTVRGEQIVLHRERPPYISRLGGRRGGIGRRARLKILFPYGSVGSTPSAGTN